MARRRAATTDPVVQALGIARERAAYFLETSPLLRFALEFVVAPALAAWSGSEAQYDRMQDGRIAEVSKRLDSIQQAGAHGMQAPGQQDPNGELIKYMRTKEMLQRGRLVHEYSPHGAAGDGAWGQNSSEWAMGLWISWSVAIGATTCSGTTCLLRAKYAQGAGSNALGVQNANEELGQLLPVDANRLQREGNCMRRRQQSMQRRMLRQARPAPRAKAKTGPACSDEGGTCPSAMLPYFGAEAGESTHRGVQGEHVQPVRAGASNDGAPQAEEGQTAKMQLAIRPSGGTPTRHVAEFARGCSVDGAQASEMCTARPSDAGQGRAQSGHTSEDALDLHPEDNALSGSLGASLGIISKRVLQFSMLAEAISGSDDATLGELAMHLHTPIAKLRQRGANWRRVSGQMLACGANAADGAVANREEQGRVHMEAVAQ